LTAIFRLIEAHRNKVWAQSASLLAYRLGCSPRGSGTRGLLQSRRIHTRAGERSGLGPKASRLAQQNDGCVCLSRPTTARMPAAETRREGALSRSWRAHLPRTNGWRLSIWFVGRFIKPVPRFCDLQLW